MKPKELLFIGITIIIIIAIILGINLIKNKDNNTDLGTIKCISENSILIVSKTCGHCADQKKILGKNLDLFDLRYIDQDKELVDKYKLEGVPAWIINERIFYGKQSINDLKGLTEC